MLPTHPFNFLIGRGSGTERKYMHTFHDFFYDLVPFIRVLIYSFLFSLLPPPFTFCSTSLLIIYHLITLFLNLSHS